MNNTRKLDIQIWIVYKKIIPEITLQETKRILNYIDRHKFNMSIGGFESNLKWLYPKLRTGEIK